MGKFFIFSLLWWLTGNPFLAVIILFVILYIVDRRFIGITPSVLKPISTRRRLASARQELSMNPHNRSAKLEAARLLMKLKRYREARRLLEEIVETENDSAEALYELGVCYLKLGQLEEGEELILKALELNPRIKFGEPFLRLGEAFAERNAEKAIVYLERFRGEHSSSCEAYYRLGRLYKKLGRTEDARQAFDETARIYRGLPKYKKRTERKYALLARFQ